MLLVSNNLRHYTPIPDHAVIRVNLAWYPTLDILKDNIRPHHSVMLDYPIGRKKPPTNQYSIKEIHDLIKDHQQIKYLAISNTNSSEDLKDFLSLPVQIVPKIESIQGVEEIDNILESLPYKEKVVMLDHEDLHHDLINNGVQANKLYTVYVEQLKASCEKSNAQLLKTTGIVFNS